MIFAHAFLGMLFAYSLEKYLIFHKSKVKYVHQKTIIWLTFIFGAIFPDIDILYVLFVDKNIFHRELPTHSLISYLLLYLIIYLLIKYKKLDRLYLNIAKAFTIAVISHLLSDLYVDRINILNPFFNESFIWAPFFLDKSQGFLGYIKSPYMFTEILIILTGQSAMLTSFAPYKNEFKLLLAVSIGVLIAAFIFLIPFLHDLN